MGVFGTVKNTQQAHLATTWPAQSISLPSLINYPDVESDIRECEAGLLASANRRRTAEERQCLLKAHSPGSARADDAKAGAARAGEMSPAPPEETLSGDEAAAPTGGGESRSAARRKARTVRDERE